jgi:hypothetical protein
MSCTSAYQPLWRAQNPAISGDKNGWVNCAAYVGGFAADYSTCGAKKPTGAQVRALTNEPVPDPASPGLTIVQVTNALARLGVTVYPFVKASWDQVLAWWKEGRYISLCGQYSVIRPTRFSGDPNFYGGHQIGVPGTFEAEDPLCDGRRAGIYKYHAEAYPVDLLRQFAGEFHVIRTNADGTRYSGPIGLGWAQGFYTVAHPAGTPTPPPVQPPQESPVKVTAVVYQEWTANGNDGVLRTTPDRGAPIAYRIPAGGKVTTQAEAEDPSGNHWRQLNYPKGTTGVAWLLRYGPGVPKDHDFIAGAILPNP